MTDRSAIIMPRITLIYGPKGTGKSAIALNLAKNLQKNGFKVGGFFQRSVKDELDRPGYDLVRFGAQSLSIPLARPENNPDDTKHATICSFAFIKDAFNTGKEWILEDSQSCDFILLDEISKLEVGGKGHDLSLKAALDSNRHLLLSVRADQLFYVVERYGLYEADLDYLEIPVEPIAIDELLAKLTQGHPAPVAS